jgi:hypothetical protein
MARNLDAKGGASSFGGSPQFFEGVTVGPKGSFGSYSPTRAPGKPSSFDAEPTFVNRWNPVTQSPKQAAYVASKQTATPARGQEVTIKGINDFWGKRAIAQGVENTGESKRVNPVTANSPKQTAYVAAKWSPEGQKPARGKEVTIKGVTDAGWGRRAVGRGGGFAGGMGGGGLMNWDTK